MATRTDSLASPDSGPRSRGRTLALYSLAWLAGAIPLFALITALWLAFPVFQSTGDITIGALALAFPVVVRQLRVPRDTTFVRFLLAAGVVFAVVSIITGWGNGLTDEPFTTPRFVSLLWAHEDPYVVPLVFNYVQYGQTIHSYSIYPYLPLLMFLQIPGLPYKWFTVGCWVLMVLLVRNRYDAGVLLAQPYVAVMAASGYNDFPVLLLLTVAFVGIAGRRQRWAQLLALGAKQFANVIVLAYYLVKRDWKNLVVTLGVSAAFILPFVIWSGPVVLCPAVLADRLPSCPSGGTAEYLLNYALWPVWVLAVFYGTVVQDTRSSARTGFLSRVLAGRNVSVDDLLRIPSFTIVGIVGALAAVSVFLGGGIFLGSSPAATIVLVVLGFLVLAGWVTACDGPGSLPGPYLRWRLSRSSFYLLVHGGALAVNLASVAGALLAGHPSWAGEIAGAFLASLWESAFFFRVLQRPDAGSQSAPPVPASASRLS